jgi:hypothetical protein
MGNNIRRSNNHKLPSYKDAIKYLAEKESNINLERLVCRIYSVAIGRDPILDANGFACVESQVTKDNAKMRQYIDGGPKPLLRPRRTPSYQYAVQFVDCSAPKEVRLISVLYGESYAKVTRDAAKAHAVQDPQPNVTPPVPLPVAAGPKEGSTKAPLTASSPVKPMESANPWRCGLCGVTLAVSEVYLHFQQPAHVDALCRKA